MASCAIDGGAARPRKKHANPIADGKYDFRTRKQAGKEPRPETPGVQHG